MTCLALENAIVYGQNTYNIGKKEIVLMMPMAIYQFRLG